MISFIPFLSLSFPSVFLSDKFHNILNGILIFKHFLDQDQESDQGNKRHREERLLWYWSCPETSHLNRIIHSRGWRKLVQLYYLHEGTGPQLLPSQGNSTVLRLGFGVACSQFKNLRLLWLNKICKYSLVWSLVSRVWPCSAWPIYHVIQPSPSYSWLIQQIFNYSYSSIQVLFLPPQKHVFLTIIFYHLTKNHCPLNLMVCNNSFINYHMMKTTCGSNAQAASLFLTKFPLHFLDQRLGVFLNGTLEFSRGFEPDAE